MVSRPEGEKSEAEDPSELATLGQIRVPSSPYAEPLRGLQGGFLRHIMKIAFLDMLL
jgi:hypothetical protein